jgi:hypothetical protein
MELPENIQVNSMFLMYLVLVIVLLVFVRFLLRIDHDKKVTYSLMDLIVDDGKIQERKVTRLGTWIVSTWGFVYLIIENKLDEWYFVGYMGVWVANAILGKIKSVNDNQEDTNA